MAKNTRLYADWRKQIEAMDQQEPVQAEFLERMEQLVPLVRAFNAVIPALVPALKDSYDRVKVAAKGMQNVLMKLEQAKPLDTGDEGAIARFVVERKRFTHLIETLHREATLANAEIGTSDQAPK